MGNEQAAMAEFAQNLWNNYIQQKVEEMLTQNVTFYLANVTANNGNHLLTIQAPLDNARTVSCTEELSNASVGAKVAVLQLGNGNAAVNHLAFLNLNANNLITNPVSIAHGGTGQTTVAAARNALGLGNTSGALPIANGGTGATTVSGAVANLGVIPLLDPPSNLNNRTALSICHYTSNATNKPSTTGGSLITMPAVDPYIHQLALPNSSGGTSTCYIRQYTANGWGGWAKL